MTTTTVPTTAVAREAAAAETFAQKVADLTTAEAAVRPARSDLRRAGVLVENAARQEALTACKEVDAEVARLSIALDAALRLLSDLEARGKAGDESLTGLELVAAEREVDLKRGNLANAEAAAQRVRRTRHPDLSDKHLANLAADIIETVTVVPVVVRTDPANAPDLSPMLVLSQRQDTKGYGTLDASGTVSLTVVGEPDLDWRGIRQAFEDAGCAVRVSDSLIEFDRAAWPLPRLRMPSSYVARQFAEAAATGWVEVIERNDVREFMAVRGYTANANGLTALTSVIEASLTAEDGKATGLVSLRLGVARRGSVAPSLSADHLLDEVKALTNSLQRRVGDLTEAGRVVSVELLTAERSDGSGWDVAARYGASGHAQWPATITVTYRVAFEYEFAAGHEIAED